MTTRIRRTTPAITPIHCWSHQEPNPPAGRAAPWVPTKCPTRNAPPAGPPHSPAQRGTQEQQLVGGGTDPQSHNCDSNSAYRPTSKDPQRTGSSVVRVWGG